MEILSVILFFLYTWGFGFTVSAFVKECDGFFEKNLCRIGIGLFTVPLAGLLLSALKIPVDWRIFLVISSVYPLYSIINNYKNFELNLNFKFKKSDFVLFFVIVIFFLVFNMYNKGSFIYPYLEDDDSWSHAIGAKYVSAQKTFFNPGGRIHYLDPYPPVYDGMFGILHQTSTSLMWTLKFFNSLIISLSVVFFYLFVKEFTDNMELALFSTAVLSMIPAYLSHFIWAHAFIPGFIFLALLSLERVKYDKNWKYIAALAISAIILTTVTHSLKFIFLFLIYFAVKCIIEKKFIFDIFFAGVIGSLISLIWWLPIAIRYGGIFDLLKRLGLAQDVLKFPIDYLNNGLFNIFLIILVISVLIIVYFFLKRKLTVAQKNIIGVLTAISILFFYLAAYSFIDGVGTADRLYDFNDFFIAHKQNMINNPVGIGIAIFLLFFITLFFIVYEQYSVIISKKEATAKIQFYILNSILALSAVSLFVSSLSFFLFRFKPGTILKRYMLSNQEVYNYVYSFSFIAWGIYLFISSILFIAGIYIFLIYKGHIAKQKLWIPISLSWFVYLFSGLYYIPTQFFTFRIWTLLAFVLSIITGYGFISMLSITKKFGIPKIIVWVLFIFLVLLTSGAQKYAVNTAIWPPGGFWTSNEEIQGYIWLKDNLPAGTRVFTFSNNGVIIGLDKFICHWCDDVTEFQKNGLNSTSQEIYGWLKARNYNYVVLDGQTAKNFGAEQTNNKLQNLISSGKFLPLHQTSGFILLKVA